MNVHLKRVEKHNDKYLGSRQNLIWEGQIWNSQCNSFPGRARGIRTIMSKTEKPFTDDFNMFSYIL
jgi:hypothetical protein